MADRDGAGPKPIFGWITRTDLVTAQVIGAGLGAVASLTGVPLLAAIGIAVGVAVLLLLPIARQALIRWIHILWRYLMRPDYEIGETKDFKAPGGLSLGLYWEGDRVCVVLQVLPPRGQLTGITREGFNSSDQLPLPELAESLVQHDIKLDSIDIISHGYRTRALTPAAGVYEQLIGPLPATAERTVWIAISLDAGVCAEAVARRGGGVEGASRAVTVAAQRIRRRLEDQDCYTRFLTKPEIDQAISQIMLNVAQQDIEQSWTAAELGEAVNIGAAVRPDHISSELLAKLWVAPSWSTTTAVRLQPSSVPGNVLLGAGWRLTAFDKPGPVDLPGMVTMSGRHREGVLAHLPVGFGDYDKTIPMGEFQIEVPRDAEYGTPTDDRGNLLESIEDYPRITTEHLHLPPAGCGQLIGSYHGEGVAARVIDPDIATVFLTGDLQLAHQVLFRALAIGKSILIRTNRPSTWAHMVTAIGNPRLLQIAAGSDTPNGDFNAALVDGVSAPAPQPGFTTIYFARDPSGMPAAMPDIAIAQQPVKNGKPQLFLRAGANTAWLEIITIAAEMPYTTIPRQRPQPRPTMQRA